MENQPTKENKSSRLDKLIKISIILAVLIVALSVVYYFIIFIPKKELQLKVDKCYEDAKKFHEDRVGETKRGYCLSPEFKYNIELDKCLYSGGYSEEGVVASFKELKEKKYYWLREVVDVYTNKRIISTNRYSSDEQMTEYWEKHRELFGD